MLNTSLVDCAGGTEADAIINDGSGIGNTRRGTESLSILFTVSQYKTVIIYLNAQIGWEEGFGPVLGRLSAHLLSAQRSR